MRCLRIGSAIGLIFLTSCGPGAADRRPLTNSEAHYDPVHYAHWIETAELGDPLVGEWTCGGACSDTTTNLVDPAGVTDLRNTHGPSGDADRGAVIWHGEIPDGVSVIALPVVAGPDNKHSRVEVRCGGATRVLNKPNNVWLNWRLHLKRPGGSCKLKIAAIDDGRDWGQWIAIGAPRAVK